MICLNLQMVKRKRCLNTIVKSGLKYKYLEDKFSDKSIHNGHVMFIYYTNVSPTETLNKLNVELNQSNYKILANTTIKSVKFTSMTKKTTMDNFKLFCMKESKLFNKNISLEAKSLYKNNTSITNIINKSIQ